MHAFTLLALVSTFSPEPDWSLSIEDSADCTDFERTRSVISDEVGADESTLRSIEVEIRYSQQLLDGRVRIVTTTGETTREFMAASCDEVVRVTALLAAISAEDAARAEEGAATKPSLQRPQAFESASPPPARSSSSPPIGGQGISRAHELDSASSGTSRSGARGAVRAGAALGYGRMPAVDLGPLVAASFRLGHLHAELAGLLLPWRSTPVRAGVDARFLHGAVALRAGPRWTIRRLDIAALLGLEAGATIGEASGASLNRRATLPWLSADLGADLTFHPHRRFGVWAATRVFATLLPQRFGFADYGPSVHASAPAGVSGVLGLEVTFP